MLRMEGGCQVEQMLSVARRNYEGNVKLSKMDVKSEMITIIARFKIRMYIKVGDEAQTVSSTVPKACP